MRFDAVVIPLDAAWSSPFVRWQGPVAELSSLDVAAQVTSRALEGSSWEIDELVLGLTVPQKQSFYGAPTLAARLGLGTVSGPLIMQACATSVACVHAAAAGGCPPPPRPGRGGRARAGSPPPPAGARAPGCSPPPPPPRGARRRARTG